MSGVQPGGLPGRVRTAAPDPYLLPAFSWRNRLARACWQVVYLLLFRPSPAPLHGWRTLLLRCFGAKLGANCHFYPGAKIWAPWNLRCEDQVTAAGGAEIYNPAPITLGSHTIVSQGAYLCGATHDHNRADFPLVAHPMHLGAYTWICARAMVAPGVHTGAGAVLGMGSVATRDLAPWTVYAGAPARPVGQRDRPGHDSAAAGGDR